VPAGGKLDVRAMSPSNEVIEQFEADLHGANAHYVYNVASGVPLYQWTAVYTPEGSGDSNSADQPPEQQLGAMRWSTTSVNHLFEMPPERIQSSDKYGATYRTVLSAANEASPERQVEMITAPADKSKLALAHARWDDTNSEKILEWLALAAPEPQFAELMAARLEHSPRDVLLLRYEQDSTEGEKHDAVCARQLAMAKAAPTDADLQYLGIRCGSKDEDKNAQFASAYKKWPKNPWLTMATAVTLAERGEYANAIPYYDAARQRLPAMRGYLALDHARLRRLTSTTGKAQLTDLAESSDQVSMLNSIERGLNLEGSPLEPYASLARGNLQLAEQQANHNKDERVWKLLAISDGATYAMIDRALSLPVDEDDFDIVIGLYAVAVKTLRDPSHHYARLEKMMGQQGKPVLDFLEHVRRGADPVQARAQLPTDFDLRLRLQAIHAAAIMLDRRAPEGWRDEAARGLFVGERGYLRTL